MTLVHQDDSIRVVLAGRGPADLFMVAAVQSGIPAGRAAQTVYRVVAEQLERNRATVVHERIFGTVSVHETVLATRQRALVDASVVPGPTTYVEGAPPWGDGLAGVIIHAVVEEATTSGVRTLRGSSGDIGRSWGRDGTEQLLLQNLYGLAEGDGPGAMPIEAEIARLFDHIERSLAAHGATLEDVVRTWFYLDDIVPSYPTFNHVRNVRYAARGLMGPELGGQLLPASTGIGGRNPRGAVAVADVLAVRGPAGAPVRRLSSHSQLEPVRYGSSFTRGAVLSSRDETILHVSGTAAIGASGESLHPGDVEAQIESTLNHIALLLASGCGATLADVAAASVFVKRPEHARVFEEEMRRRGLGAFPAVVVVADVCRDELLFELDAEVLVSSRG